jgi:hypothetical protein
MRCPPLPYLRLNTLLISTEIECSLGSGEDLELARLMCPLQPIAPTVQMDKHMGTFIDASAGIPASVEMHCSTTYRAGPLYYSHLSSRSLDKHSDKDTCDTEQLQNFLQIRFNISSLTSFRVWYLVSTSTESVLYSAAVISPSKLLLTLHSQLFTRTRDF